ncbi:MAG: M56 family metallopeptidase, partial [Allosphingosinicella sp.]
MSLDFLLEMGWKSAAIAGVSLALIVLLRARSAADRAALLRLSVLLLLALPVISLVLPKLEVESWFQAEAALSVPAPLPAAAAPAAPAAVEAMPFAMLEEPVAYEPEAASLSLGLSLILLYAAGALLVLARLLAGLWTLRRWTAAGRAPHSPAWTAAFQRAVAGRALKREVRLLVSDDVPSPMSWGRVRPIILIDPASHARGEDAEAILAHEMAHVRRGDWPALMLSRLAVALFWFNPLVWMLERALIQQAEEAADLQAVNGLEPTLYAKSLIACIRCSGLHAVPANGMARADGLSRRVHAVLDARLRSMPTGGVLTVAAMLAAVLISAPLSALKLVPARAEAPAEPFAPAVPAALPA